MEFLDEDSRPRIQFQSRAVTASSQSTAYALKSLNKVLIFFTTSIGIALLCFTFLYASNLEPVTSILLWIAVSILIGPFAPESVTGGDVRVGNGPELEDPEPDLVESEVKKPKQPRGGSRKIEEQSLISDELVKRIVEKRDTNTTVAVASVKEEVETEWTEEDFELLKKQMVKNPIGKARRWEVITEAFGGRHKVDSVVKMAKSMAERKIGNEDDSYAQFLKHRKPLDNRAVDSDNGMKEDCELEVETGWSVGEDKALLNALKAFPKDVTMRWEKISAAVPGRSKKACMKRVADLKKDFRSSKAS